MVVRSIGAQAASSPTAAVNSCPRALSECRLKAAGPAGTAAALPGANLLSAVKRVALTGVWSHADSVCAADREEGLEWGWFVRVEMGFRVGVLGSSGCVVW